MNAREVAIPSGDVELPGTLALPRGASGVVLFAHGSGSSRHSRRNQQVAAAIARAGIGTLVFDLLSAEEEAADRFSGHLRFDIDLLASRLVDATHWLDHARSSAFDRLFRRQHGGWRGARRRR